MSLFTTAIRYHYCRELNATLQRTRRVHWPDKEFVVILRPQLGEDTRRACWHGTRSLREPWRLCRRRLRVCSRLWRSRTVLQGPLDLELYGDLTMLIGWPSMYLSIYGIWILSFPVILHTVAPSAAPAFSKSSNMSLACSGLRPCSKCRSGREEDRTPGVVSTNGLSAS